MGYNNWYLRCCHSSPSPCTRDSLCDGRSTYNSARSPSALDRAQSHSPHPRVSHASIRDTDHTNDDAAISSHRVLSLMIPAAFFAALDGGSVPTTAGAVNPVSDEVRGMFLKMSRGVAILLLCV